MEGLEITDLVGPLGLLAARAHPAVLGKRLDEKGLSLDDGCGGTFLFPVEATERQRHRKRSD